MTQFCAEPGCHVLVSQGWCPAHTRHARVPGYAEIHRWYTSVRWLRLRADVLRAEPFCRSCLGEGRNTLTTDIDHVIKHEGDPVLLGSRQPTGSVQAVSHREDGARRLMGKLHWDRKTWGETAFENHLISLGFLRVFRERRKRVTPLDPPNQGRNGL